MSSNNASAAAAAASASSSGISHIANSSSIANIAGSRAPEMSSSERGGYCGALQRAPPPMPAGLARRLANRDNFGIGKVSRATINLPGELVECNVCTDLVGLCVHNLVFFLCVLVRMLMPPRISGLDIVFD